MRPLVAAFTLLFACSLPAGPAAADHNPNPAAPAVKYAVKVHEFEGCECNPVCPCVFSRDASFSNCRGLTVFTFNGTYGPTTLKDVSCVLVFTWSGKNMEATMGKWKGVLYTADTGTPAEREAIRGLLHAMLGNGFASLEEHTAPIQIQRKDDVHELTLGKVGRLRIHAFKGPNGEVTKIVNAPFRFASPVLSCAVTDIHTYDDGKSSWSFPGRNAFYADFDLATP